MGGVGRTGTTHGDLVKLSKLQGSVSVDGRSDVLAVVAVLHRLQLPDAAHVGQPGLNLRHVQHLGAAEQSAPPDPDCAAPCPALTLTFSASGFRRFHSNHHPDSESP